MIRADGGYNAGQVEAPVAGVPVLRMEIVKRSDDMKGFVVLPRRWVVERAFSCSDETVSPRTSRTWLPSLPWPPSSSLSGALPGRRSRVCKGLDSRPSPARTRTTRLRRFRPF